MTEPVVINSNGENGNPGSRYKTQSKSSAWSGGGSHGKNASHPEAGGHAGHVELQLVREGSGMKAVGIGAWSGYEIAIEEGRDLFVSACGGNGGEGGWGEGGQGGADGRSGSNASEHNDAGKGKDGGNGGDAGYGTNGGDGGDGGFVEYVVAC